MFPKPGTLTAKGMTNNILVLCAFTQDEDMGPFSPYVWPECKSVSGVLHV